MLSVWSMSSQTYFLSTSNMSAVEYQFLRQVYSYNCLVSVAFMLLHSIIQVYEKIL